MKTFLLIHGSWHSEGQAILVGHSKNGIIVSQVAEYRPGKIEKLIYLAAYLIPDGKTQAEYSASPRCRNLHRLPVVRFSIVSISSYNRTILVDQIRNVQSQT